MNNRLKLLLSIILLVFVFYLGTIADNLSEEGKTYFLFKKFTLSEVTNDICVFLGYNEGGRTGSYNKDGMDNVNCHIGEDIYTHYRNGTIVFSPVEERTYIFGG